MPSARAGAGRGRKEKAPNIIRGNFGESGRPPRKGRVRGKGKLQRGKRYGEFVAEAGGNSGGIGRLEGKFIAKRKGGIIDGGIGSPCGVKREGREDRGKIGAVRRSGRGTQ